MDTIEYATFRYDTAEVENGLKSDLIRSEHINCDPNPIAKTYSKSKF